MNERRVAGSDGGGGAVGVLRPWFVGLAVFLAFLGEWVLGRARFLGNVRGSLGVSGPWQVGAGFFLVAAVIFAVVTLPPDRWGEWRRGWARGWSRSRRWDFIVLLLVTLVAAVARVYRIHETPAGLWLDETDIAKQALEIVNGARPKPWDVARLEVPWLYHYYVALFYKLLGPGYLTVKLPHLVISVLTAPVLYLLARQWFEPPIALASALLWATMRWSINMSRWGHVNTLTVFWICVVLLCLWRAQATGRWRWWLLGGAALGLSQYAYQSSRALVGIVVLFLLYRAVTPRGYFRRTWAPILAFWGMFALVYAPLAWTYIQHPNLFLERSWAISIFNPLFTRDPWAALWSNLGKYAGVFHYRGDPNGRHNIPGEPMLDPITGVLFLFGLVVALRHPRRPEHALLLLWIAPYLAVGVLTTEAPNTFRIYAITPVIALFAGLGLQAVLSSGLSGVMARGRVFAFGGYVLLGVIVAGAAWLNLTKYFDVQATHPGVVGQFNVGPTRVGQYIASLPDDAVIYLDRQFWGFSPIEVINPGRSWTRLIAPDHIPPPERDRPVVYILGTYGQRLLPYLKQLYPDAIVDRVKDPLDGLIFTAVRLEAETASRRGLKAQWWRGVRAEGDPTVADIVSPGEVPLPAPAYGVLQGGLSLPKVGEYGFRVEGARQTRLIVAGREIVTAPDVPATATLPGGVLPVRWEVAVGEGQVPRVLWRPPGAEGWSPVPEERWYPLDLPPGGLLAMYFEGAGLRKPPVRIAQDPILYAENAGALATAAMRWLGRLRVPETGTYTFGLSSDDGSRLWVDDRLVVDNWGIHGAGWKDASVELDKGWHTLRIEYIDHGGSFWFEARWTPPGRPPGPLPPELLTWTEEDMARALAPVESPEPVLRVVDAAGNVVDTVPIARARLQDPTWSRPVGDANFQGWPMTLGNQMFDHGIGLYGPGEVDFLLNGRFRRFQGIVGVDIDTYGDSHTQVQVLGDGRVLWDSGVIHPWDPPTRFDIDVTGVQVLTLKQIEAGHFEGRGDGVDWVNPVLRGDVGG